MNPVGKFYFNYNLEKNESTCNIKQCQRPTLKGRLSHNMETHIKSYPSTEYKYLELIKKELTEVKKTTNWMFYRDTSGKGKYLTSYFDKLNNYTYLFAVDINKNIFVEMGSNL